MGKAIGTMLLALIGVILGYYIINTIIYPTHTNPHLIDINPIK